MQILEIYLIAAIVKSHGNFLVCAGKEETHNAFYMTMMLKAFHHSLLRDLSVRVLQMILAAAKLCIFGSSTTL